jgi:hypothetical protein
MNNSKNNMLQRDKNDYSVLQNEAVKTGIKKDSCQA